MSGRLALLKYEECEEASDSQTEFGGNESECRVGLVLIDGDHTDWQACRWNPYVEIDFLSWIFLLGRPLSDRCMEALRLH
jgi:hypothetical protein